MIATQPSKQYPHVEWIDLHNNGVLVECGVMRKDRSGNIYFIELARLDNVDKRRFFSVITNKNSAHYPLWELMSQITLGNGSNALEYFHQLVRVLTPHGQIINPKAGVTGSPTGVQTMPAQIQMNEAKTEIKMPKNSGGTTIGK